MGNIMTNANGKSFGKAGLVVMAAIVALALSVAVAALPNRAVAAPLSSTTTQGLAVQAASYDKTAVSDAKKLIKKAKAATGTDAAKLKKIYTYIATDKSFKGTYQIESLPYFKVKYGATYYSYLPREVVQNKLLSKYYKKYAVDMFKDKKGTCFHYAALFGIAAKQALGKSATVKIAAGASKHTGSKVDYHSWVEVKLGKKTYVYDPQAGNTTAKTAGSATEFGKFCGSVKNKLKANYYNYKGVQYTTVKL